MRYLIIGFFIFIILSVIFSNKNGDNFVSFNASYMIDEYKKHNIKYNRDSRNFTNNINKYILSSRNHFNSSISNYKCKYKDVTSNILGKHKIPVANHIVWDSSKSIDNNLDKISKLIDDGFFKYPLVVKPTTGTQGYGVYVNLYSLSQIKKKILPLIKKGKTVMIEQQVTGNNYRIMVFNNEIIDVVERKKPFVIGNGKDNLKNLIKKYNIKQKQNGDYVIHNFSLNYIKKQGFALDSIIPTKKKVIVSNTVNYHNGSPIVRIPINKMNPENIVMFKKVNKKLGLNLSGIDYMSSSLEKSYLIDGHIIEVNHLPDMKIHRKAQSIDTYNPIKKFVSLIFK